jgi:hypothetical protein
MEGIQNLKNERKWNLTRPLLTDNKIILEITRVAISVADGILDQIQKIEK